MTPTSRPAAEARDRARELWSAGYSVRYISSALGVGGKTAKRLIGRKLLVQRELWRWLADAEGRR